MSFGLKQFFKKQTAQVFLGLLLALFFLNVSVVSATERSYSYDAINFEIRINKDSTVDIKEYQGFNFIGEYHQGWRNIPKKGIDDLTNILVIDEGTGKPLTYSPKRLEKTSPKSWGKYTTFFENGEYIIEWYYDAKDIRRTYELRYTLHGAIGFYKDHDELYWNLFTGYAVPIGQASALVFLPETVTQDDLSMSLYVHPLPADHEDAKWYMDIQPDGRAFSFVYRNIPPGADMTIAPGWSKGIVDQSAYWKSWLQGNWGYVGAVIVALLTVITIILRWFFTERYRAGRGLVIPEYSPPQDLPPAMADILVHEGLSPQAWAATVIDLAIRGYIKIEEKKKGKIALVPQIIFLVFMVIVISIIQRGASGNTEGVLMIIFILILFSLLRVFWQILSGKKSAKSIFDKTDYILTRLKVFEKEIPSLQHYEKKFLDTIFSSGHFDTQEIRRNPDKGTALHKGFQEIEKILKKETASDTKAYVVGFRTWRISRIVLLASGGIILWILFSTASASNHGVIVFLSVASYCLLAVFLFFRFNPRLNKQGQILREEWLGFKLYLETAEKYRMQNLTPETFEKYLPYAIIFGVEKKWGKAFDGIAMPQPTWYSAASIGAETSSVSSEGFSPFAFSSSFSSSFSSAFSSAGGGGGASGGGGGAGGGGGGGGGGAS